MDGQGISRRKVVVGGLALGAAGVAGVSLAGEGPGAGGSSKRMPVVFVPHGGGPWPFVDIGFGTKEETEGLADYLRSIAPLPAEKPKALLVISAHWEESRPTVSTSARPPMLYDYYGFPPVSYEIQWPAPGDPALAARVRDRLAAAGIETGIDPDRGYDHGTFVPMKLAYPNADVPTVQLSLQRGLDPAAHLAMGRALAPLRDEGVYIMGSGMTYHDLRNFGPRARDVSEVFDAWLREAGSAAPADRDRLLERWQEAPMARRAHPREEHLLPMMVIAGAAGADQGVVAWRGTFAGVALSAYHFGA